MTDRSHIDGTIPASCMRTGSPPAYNCQICQGRPTFQRHAHRFAIPAPERLGRSIALSSLTRDLDVVIGVALLCLIATSIGGAARMPAPPVG